MPTLAPRLQIEQHLARITLRRPKVANRLEVEDLQILEQQLDVVNAQTEVRVLLLEAEGRYFCSGFNIGAVPGVDAGALFERLTDAWENARPITIAAIQGGVYGGATDLALACDFRLGTSACEMFVPAARLGLHFYRGGMTRYVNRLGLGMAKRILLACETLDARAMQNCGFLDHLYEDETQLRAQALTLAQSLCELAPLALAGMKRHLNALARHELDSALLAADIARAAGSQDLAEGVRAWQERRPPRFTGH
ncbi:enoyl-CoA hydratase/isomerase family protein [Mitsuaria sp. WAJ17]|uniref:enoyl-CoA hydratase/isomerase family protein n=1 Tax=Mitsuaria sp. WAJ17 TaxID=2761452 RepID=UPI001601DC9B|nr:enoyl-CoA hydratase/isomerase family protein [Mitsuaria sp. WAJ17]MBB2485265.1 enoyl-CoA hydratase/isomerase family protein [Mitsuaria sp. WAJ17]